MQGFILSIAPDGRDVVFEGKADPEAAVLHRRRLKNKREDKGKAKKQAGRQRKGNKTSGKRKARQQM